MSGNYTRPSRAVVEQGNVGTGQSMGSPAVGHREVEERPIRVRYPYEG